MLEIVGMGGKPSDLTKAGGEAIARAAVVVVKSEKTFVAEAVAEIRKDYLTCDVFYDVAEDFENLNDEIIKFLSRLCQKGDVAFCVVGNGCDDSTAAALKEKKVPFRTIAGVDAAKSIFDYGASDDAISVSANALTAKCRQTDVIIKYIDDQLTASDVKLALSKEFDFDTPVLFCDGENSRDITLFELDRQPKYGYLCSAVLFPKALTFKSVFTYSDAFNVLKSLRGEGGCPWDRVQTHKSLEKNVIEEAYELVAAIENNDVDNIIEELGDVLMQVLFHTEIAEDEGEFTAADVYSALCRKLIFRHPHVFGEAKAVDDAEALVNWEAAKQREHKISDISANLDDIPLSFAASMYAAKAQHRASKGGYAFNDLSETVKKLQKELFEFLKACENGGADEKERLGGDLLFYAVSLLRLNGVDAETALFKSAKKFVANIKNCEKILSDEGKKLSDLTSSEFDALWQLGQAQ